MPELSSVRGKRLPRIDVVVPSRRYEEDFLKATRRSRRLHGRYVSPPRSAEDFRAYVARQKDPRYEGRLILDRESGELAAVINMNEIVRGGFQSAFLGYFALEPFAGRGYVEAGLRRIASLAFSEIGLHRLEANIQPDNLRSIELVRRIGFRLEGYSPRYLKVAGRWRDHERWALTREDKRPK